MPSRINGNSPHIDFFEPRPVVPVNQRNRNWFRRVGTAYRHGRREGNTLNYVLGSIMPFTGNRFLNNQLTQDIQRRRDNRFRNIVVQAEGANQVHPYGYAPEKPPSYKSVKSSSSNKTKKKKTSTPPPKYVSPSPSQRSRKSRGGNNKRTRRINKKN
jgi:hypothetical protein